MKRGHGEAEVFLFIVTTFSHACPTRVPGNETRMRSVLTAFFSEPVSGEEKTQKV